MRLPLLQGCGWGDCHAGFLAGQICLLSRLRYSHAIDCYSLGLPWLNEKPCRRLCCSPLLVLEAAQWCDNGCLANERAAPMTYSRSE